MERGTDTRIAPTAHYTAYVWHRLGLPYAEYFSTRLGATLFWGFRMGGEWLAAASSRVPSMVQYLEERHLLIEHQLEALEPDRIVELGAGLSRRGVTWALDREVSYVEVDLPHMIAAKRERIGAMEVGLRRRLEDRHRMVTQDVRGPDFSAWLAEALKGAARPVVVAEGLLGYFPRDAREEVASAVASALGGRGALVCDLRIAGEGGRAVAGAARFLKGGIRLVTQGRGVAEDFASEADVLTFFSDAGYATASAVDPAHLGREKRPATPARIWWGEPAPRGVT